MRALRSVPLNEDGHVSCCVKVVTIRRRAQTMDTGADLYSHSRGLALGGVGILPAHHATSGTNIGGGTGGIPPLMHSFSVGSPSNNNVSSVPCNSKSLGSPRGPAFYSSEDTVESVIGQSVSWLS